LELLLVMVGWMQPWQLGDVAKAFAEVYGDYEGGLNIHDQPMLLLAASIAYQALGCAATGWEWKPVRWFTKPTTTT
jgi:hypothetical protein